MQHRLSMYNVYRTWKVPPFSQPRDSFLRAQGWLLIMAGDVELNPGPEPQPVAIFLSYRHDDRASYVGFQMAEPRAEPHKATEEARKVAAHLLSYTDLF